MHREIEALENNETWVVKDFLVGKKYTRSSITLMVPLSN